jgi:hypothetical protein
LRRLFISSQLLPRPLGQRLILENLEFRWRSFPGSIARDLLQRLLMASPILIHPATSHRSQLLETNFMGRILVVGVYCFKIDENALSPTRPRVDRFPYMVLWNVLGSTWLFRRWI